VDHMKLREASDSDHGGAWGGGDEVAAMEELNGSLGTLGRQAAVAMAAMEELGEASDDDYGGARGGRDEITAATGTRRSSRRRRWWNSSGSHDSHHRAALVGLATIWVTDAGGCRKPPLPIGWGPCDLSHFAYVRGRAAEDSLNSEL
jgi:hypothetical protein